MAEPSAGVRRLVDRRECAVDPLSCLAKMHEVEGQGNGQTERINLVVPIAGQVDHLAGRQSKGVGGFHAAKFGDRPLREVHSGRSHCCQLRSELWLENKPTLLSAELAIYPT